MQSTIRSASRRTAATTGSVTSATRVLDGDARHGEIGDDLVEVQFQGVSARLFDNAGELQPPFGRRAVERSDDGYLDRLFHATQVQGIFLRSLRIFVAGRKRCKALGELRL